MIKVTDLAQLGLLFPSGSLDAPEYVITGGCAVLCWLHNTHYNREHGDIDLLVLDQEKLRLPNEAKSSPFFAGNLAQGGIVSASENPLIEFQLVDGIYFDSEISPKLRDMRTVNLQQIPLIVLSPEFLAISKFSYPNVHRFVDFFDVIALNKNGYLSESEYLNSLLLQTSLGQMIDAQDILQAKTAKDFHKLVDFIHLQLVRRFLYWEPINVELLDVLQCFVLIDMGDELQRISEDVIQLIGASMDGLLVSRRLRQLAMLGYCFLALELPIGTLEEILRSSNSLATVSRYLPTHINSHLACFKRVMMILRTLRQIEALTNCQFNAVWQFDTIERILNRVLFTDSSRFTLLASVRTIYNDIIAGQTTISSCVNTLSHEFDLSAEKLLRD
jgi:hypothetical protein